MQLFREPSFFCFLTVIGGYNIYVNMSNISGQCSRKDSLWETLQKEVMCMCNNNNNNNRFIERLNYKSLFKSALQ